MAAVDPALLAEAAWWRLTIASCGLDQTGLLAATRPGIGED